MNEINGTAVSREALLALRPPPPVPVHVAGVGTFHVRKLTLAERDTLNAHAWSGNAQKSTEDRIRGFRAMLALLCLCDGDGKRLFADDEAVLVSGLDAAVLEPVIEKAVEVNGLGAAEAGDAEKNSGSARNGASA